MWPKRCLRGEGECDLVLLDLSADGKPEIVMLGTEEKGRSIVMGENKTGQWQVVGRLPWAFGGCKPLRQKLLDGQFRVVAPAMGELEIAGTRIGVASPVALGPVECGEQPR